MWIPLLSALWRSLSEDRPARRKPASARPNVEALEGRAVPAFLAPLTSPGGGGALAVADFNHDGRADVVVLDANVVSYEPTGNWTISSVTLNRKSTVSVSLSMGDGTFQKSATLGGVAGYYLNSLSVRDVNGDGHLDVVVSTSDKNIKKLSASVYSVTSHENVWLGNGDGTFGSVRFTSSKTLWPVSPEFMRSPYPSADFNHDGITDQVLLYKFYDDYLKVYLSNGDGTFQHHSYATGPSPGFLAAGDFDGDGWTDLIVVNSLSSASPTLSVLFNEGNW